MSPQHQIHVQHFEEARDFPPPVFHSFVHEEIIVIAVVNHRSGKL